MLKRVLLTGAGSIARRHAHILAALRPDLELSVVTQHPQERLLDWNVPVVPVRSAREGLSAGVDAVIVCSVSARHAQELVQVLALGLPVLAEKPLVTDVAGLQSVRAALASAHPASQIGCNLRFLPSLQRVRTFLDRGDLGGLVRASFEAGQWLPDWRPGRPLASSYSSQELAGGGVVFDLVHEIDAAEWMLGPLALTAAEVGRFSSLPISVDDTALALMRTSAGRPVSIAIDYVSRRPVRRYTFVGDSGTLTWDLQKRLLTFDSGTDQAVVEASPEAFDIAQTYHAQMQEWLAAITQRRPPATCPLSSALSPSALMLDIHNSTR